jgi:hypothetical protein
VQQGFLRRLRAFDWDEAVASPQTARRAARLRGALRSLLWASAHPWPVLGVALVGVALLRRWRCAPQSGHAAPDRRGVL